MKALLLALALPTLVLGQMRSPAHYEPEAIPLKGKQLTSAEHDKKYAEIPHPYVLRFKSVGELLYAGTTHTYDPADKQIAYIQQLWSDFKPTVALVEGTPDVVMATLEGSVKKFGEGGAVLWLAENAKVKVYTMEPSRQVEAAYLLERHSKERVALFFVIRTYLSDRRTRTMTDQDASRILARRQQQYGLVGTIPDLASLDALWAKEFPGHKGWRTMEEREMWPNDGTWLNKLAKHANEVRDTHFLRTMIDLTRKGERVFAVSGCSHTIIQEPVLRATFGK